MATEYMQQSVEAFCARLRDIEEKLGAFSSSIDAQRSEVFAALNTFEQSSRVSHDADGGDDVAQALRAAMSDMAATIAAWHEKIEADNKGKKFMEQHEQYLVLMIFGAVKAGKSTLGNFFAGRDFRAAGFDNAYKQMPPARFAIYDKKRDTGGIVTDEAGQQWFAEGFLDTTGNIQGFTLGGLRWMDSPGTGAVAKNTDVADGRSMDEMVAEYISCTDMCIFLINSSEPGLQEDMRYIQRLDKDNQTAIVVITRSDVMEEDEDADGNIVSFHVAKSADCRRRQEESVCAQVRESCPNVPVEKYRAISISTYLAQQGIEKEDDEVYRSGNLDGLMRLIGERLGDDIVAFKEKRPKERLNAFLDGIISNADEGGGLQQLGAQFSAVRQHIEEKKKALDARKRSIGRLVKQTVENELRRNIRRWATEMEHSGGELSDHEISRRLIGIANPILQEQINNEIGHLIADYRRQNVETFALSLSGGGLRKEQKEIEQRWTEVYYEDDPDGIWENIKSILGFKQFKRRTNPRVEKRTIDLGTNIEDYLEKVAPMLHDALTAHIEKSLDRIKESYFKPQEEYAETMQRELKVLADKLEQMKFRIAE